VPKFVAAPIAFLFLASPAFADMSKKAMASASDTARQSGFTAALYELCHVNAQKLKNAISDAADSCHASSNQTSKLEALYDRALDDQKSILKNNGFKCRLEDYSDVKYKFEALVKKLQTLARSPC
jgi:hypothetical protein